MLANGWLKSHSKNMKRKIITHNYACISKRRSPLLMQTSLFLSTNYRVLYPHKLVQLFIEYSLIARVSRTSANETRIRIFVNS